MKSCVPTKAILLLLIASSFSACTLLHPNEVDKDGDGWLVSDGDCDDNDRNYHPGALDPEFDCDSMTNSSSSSNSSKSQIGFSSSSVQSVDLSLLSNFVTESHTGKTGYDYFKSVGATAISPSGTIQQGRLVIDVASGNYPNVQTPPKSLAVGIYVGLIDRKTFHHEKEWSSFLDAEWIGDCSDHLNTSHALDYGGVFFLGQNRRLDFDLSLPLPLANKNHCIKESDTSLNLLELINTASSNNKLIYIGFYTSTPGFGKIVNAKIVYSGGSIEKKPVIPF